MSMKRISHLVAFLFVLVALPHPAHAELHIDITRGKVEPMAVAIPDFYAEEGKLAPLGRDLAGVITADLRRSGLFEPISPQIFIQTPKQINDKGPDFSAWRSINSPAVVSGTVSRAKDGRTRVEFRLWDVYAQKQLQGMAYMTTPQNWRRIAHIISDEIYKRLTGETGYFDSRIVFISETGPATSRIKKLAIMDQDGANYRELTDGANLVLTPRFSPTGPEITYLAYHNNRPRVYLYNIDTGRREVLGDFPGMTFAPRFSPDGNKVIMSLAMNGNSDIYTMDLRTREVKQLTNHLAIDTSPSYSPDAKEVVFESDRGGTQQLYVMDGKGGNVRRITFGDGRYANPVWSPRGDLIAFTKMVGGNFYIGVIRPDGSGERLITQAYHVEGPTWSPNGRVLSYFKELPVGPGGTRRRARLYSIDLTGFNEQELPTPQDASDPAWSPLNP